MNIIQIRKQDIGIASQTLANAFRHDPIFKYIFKSSSRYYRTAPWLFSTWIKWAMLYGNAWMTDDGSVVLLTRAPGRAKMSLGSMIKAGMLLTPFKMGCHSFCRFFFKVVALLDKKNSEFMGTNPHWYGWMVGINNEQPDKKAKELLDYYLGLTEESGLPVYIETESKIHVRYYTRWGFKLAGQTNVSDNLTIYFMVKGNKESK